MRSENIDFVTIKTSLNTLKKKHERSDEDNAILAKARVESLMRGQEFFLTEHDLSRFHLTLKGDTYIFQTSGTKIIAERVSSNELAIKAFEKGAPRTVSHATALAIENYLRSKSLITDLTLIAGPLSSSCVTSTQDESEVIISEKNWALFFDADLEGDQSVSLNESILPVVFPPFFAMAPDLSFQAALNEDHVEDLSILFKTQSDESMTTTFLISERQLVAPPQDTTTTEEAPQDFESECDIGLKIHDLIARMGAGYSVDDVRKCVDELNAIEGAIPGILQGLAIPSFEKACLICFERILGGKNCFIDDLDETLLNLGLAAGLLEDDVKMRMSERALKLFINNLSIQAGKPLKKSRAEKIRAFGFIAGRKIMGSSPLFAQAKKLVEDIYEHEAMRTLKPNQDQDLIRLYSKLTDWFAKN